MDCGLARQVGMTIGVRPFYNPLLSAALIFAEASEPRMRWGTRCATRLRSFAVGCCR
jgi:hypothetical protein